MSEIETRNAVIRSVFLGKEDHGIPSFMISCYFGNVGQGFGGYDLRFKGYGIDLIMEIIDVVGASSWEGLVGKNIRVKSEHAQIHAIGHIIEDKWCEPATRG